MVGLEGQVHNLVPSRTGAGEAVWAFEASASLASQVLLASEVQEYRQGENAQELAHGDRPETSWSKRVVLAHSQLDSP